MVEAKTLKVKKKRWYPILAPKMFRQVHIGEILLDDARKSIGRVITSNLMELTNDIKKQNINMKFVIKNIEGDRLLTETNGYEIIPASIRRIVRRGRERLDSSISCLTSDNKRIRVKTLLLTRSIVKGSIKASLIKNSNDYLKKAVKSMQYSDLIAELVSHKLQKIMYSQLSKIYPLKTCEVREMKIEKEKRAVEEPKVEEIKESPKEDKKETKEIKESPKEEKKEEKETKQEAPREEAKKGDDNAKASN